MKRRRPATITVPDDWTPAEAALVCDFLAAVLDAVSSRYGAQIRVHERRLAQQAFDDDQLDLFDPDHPDCPF